MLQIYDALKIAIESVEKRSVLRAGSYTLTVTHVNGEWVFWFVFLPQTPGADVTVIVDGNGRTRMLAGI
jgi:hypothetical protein